MPYSALPAARRRHYEIDGTVIGYNQASSFTAGAVTIASQTEKNTLNGETPSVDSGVFPSYRIAANTIFIYVFFPEQIDLQFYCVRTGGSASSANDTLSTVASSSDTTTGADGTWTNLTTTTGTALSAGTGDWWRSITPRNVTANGTNIRAIRFSLSNNDVAGTRQIRNLYIWGTKHSGETPDDVIVLESDNSTEWPNDDDWGDLNAGSAAVTHQYYVKNASATKTANSVVVKPSGSDSARWDVSLDNVSFASSQSVGNLAAGASQVVYFRFTPPAAGTGVYRPYAAYIEADVASWT